MEHDERLDSVFDADRGTGSTPPESGAESSDVVGRPAVEHPRTAFHEPAETADEERTGLDDASALDEGGSFDAIVPPGA
jgi:hypothetical protein